MLPRYTTRHLHRAALVTLLHFSPARYRYLCTNFGMLVFAVDLIERYCRSLGSSFASGLEFETSILGFQYLSVSTQYVYESDIIIFISPSSCMSLLFNYLIKSLFYTRYYFYFSPLIYYSGTHLI